MREESYNTRQKEKRKTTRHIPSLTSQHHPAIPADTDPHPIILFSTHHSTILYSPYPHPRLHHPYTLSAYHPLITYCPLLLHPPPVSTTPCHCTTIRVYILARNCTHACLSLATARPQLVFRSLTVATVPRRLATTAYLYRYQPDCCLHTVHMSVCTTVIISLSSCRHFGFSPCAHHDLSFSPSVCHPGHLRYHQSLTRVHSHSLPVPPPLPLADARSQGGSTVGRSRSLACGLWCPLVLHGSPCW